VFEVVLQTRVYFYLQAYDIWDKINSAQTNKADPDFEFEVKHVDTNLISIFVVQVKQKSHCSKNTNAKQLFLLLQVFNKHPRKSVMGINSVGKV